MKRRLVSLIGLVSILVILFAIPGSAQGPDVGPIPKEALEEILGAKNEPEIYIIQLINDPVIAYEGDISGLPATKPGRGEHINPNSAAVRKYVKFLESKHVEALSKAGGNKVYDYFYSFNGFAAVLTPAQAVAIAKHPGVVRLFVDELKFPDTENSPDFLGLTDTGGLWDMEIFGEDVIVGVIDTGIWPEHPSFSDQEDLVDRPGSSGKRTLAYDDPPSHWYGTCQSGELWSQDDCNNKLIGARYFLDGFGHHGVIRDDYLSARDADGHGSHTASTAAGNAGPNASILGSDLGTISGMAPRARIAVYKTCWNDAGCAVSDLTRAIDQAVADGVDVINYSIGSSATTLGPDDVAFLFAADAGVYVATSAGNSGPGAGTIGSPGWTPWITTVGANTQDRTFRSTVTLGNDDEYDGLGLGVTVELPLVDADAAGDELCNMGALDSSIVSGNIVLCKRGAIPLIYKSQAVLMAGGAGMILYNQAPGMDPYLTTHAVPTAHIGNLDGLAIKTYIDTDPSVATAVIDGGHADTRPAPWMAEFSSRGPNGGAGDIIKPDITAPGFGILAAYSPTPFFGGPGELYSVIQGTSMSSPHVAGIFALLKDAHPEWTAAMARSAIMTTADANVMKEDGVTLADPFDIGAGHLTPNPAVDPGLVYHAGLFEYAAFTCGANLGLFTSGSCAFLDSLGIPFDASDLNYPSIGIASLPGSQTVTRTVTNVGPAGIYNVSVNPPPGVLVSVSPTSLTLAEDDVADYTVTFTVTTAPLDQWVFGSLTWSDGTRNVLSPIAVRPVALAAPAEVQGVGSDGSLEFDVKYGYTGNYTAGVHGLVAADRQPDTVADDPANDINDALDTCDFGAAFPWPCTGITWHTVTVPSGSAYLRVSLFDDFTDGDDDLDLYVWDSTFPAPTSFVGGSGSPTSEEQVDVPFPADTTYLVAVHGWQTDGPDANYTLFNWAFGPAITNMTVSGAPSSVSIGDTATLTVNWIGLTSDEKYMGAVSHDDGADIVALTLVKVSTE
jgi:subtilisin family serine protease